MSSEPERNYNNFSLLFCFQIWKKKKLDIAHLHVLFSMQIITV